MRLRRLAPLCLGLLTLVATSAFAAETAKPNIVFILADDLGYGDLSCYGQTHFRTPNIDRLAAEGRKFTQFYAGSTVCAPSRCVLMTGLHTGHCFIRGNARLNLRPEDVTVAEVLKNAGYATGLFGKWGLGQEGSTGVPTQQGFDEFFGYLDQHHAHNYYPAFLHRGEERVPLKNVVPGDGPFGSGVATKKVEYSADLILDEALGFVDRHKDRPFFLYYAATLPHANNEGKKEGMEIPDLGEFADKDWPPPQKGLAAMIAKLDAGVGQLMDKLADQGLAENTLVMFSSDNGPHSEGGNDAEFFNSNGPLRGIKRAPYDGGIRVPFIARWPGKIPAGTTSDHVGYFGDLMATATEVSGGSQPDKLDSVSFVPALLGKPNPPQHEFLYWEFYEQGSFQALRIGDWKAVVRPIGGGDVELYNLKNDLDESDDVAAQHPEVIAKAREIFKREHVPSSNWKVPADGGKAKNKRTGSKAR